MATTAVFSLKKIIKACEKALAGTGEATQKHLIEGLLRFAKAAPPWKDEITIDINDFPLIQKHLE